MMIRKNDSFLYDFKIIWRDSRLFSKPGLFLRVNYKWYHLFNPKWITDAIDKIMKE